MAPKTPDNEPLAIVGMAYRFPGDASNDTKLWDLLENGRSAWSKIPENRFSQEAYYHPDPQRAGTIAAKGGYFLDDDPAAFDAPFFGVSPAEASALDPQQRFLLETTYECLESAGMPISKIRGSNTGCFTGSFLRDYDAMSSADILDVPYVASALHKGSGGFLSNRVSWFFDLKGPSLQLDTACSSSLIAFHLACQSIWTGESDQALASGSNLILMPNSMRALTQLQFLSPDGICNSFDARANGYARGEGVAVLMIKPVRAAVRDGDCIRAIVRGTASNQNGRTPGITMPSTEAQASLIRTAYAQFGLDLDTTGFFEAHGTGTPIGDPLEFNAIAQTLVSKETRTFPLYVGSVKSNIGHLEGTAGLAGLVKAILCVEKGMIPPIAGFESPNLKLKLDDPNLQLATKLLEWPTTGIRRASVNSFGAGGSNAHVVIDDAASYLRSAGLDGNHRTSNLASAPASDSGIGSSDSSEEDGDVYDKEKAVPRIFTFSTPEQAGLQRTSASYAKYLEEKMMILNSGSGSEKTSSVNIAQLAETLSTRRSEFEWKSFAVASSITELQSSLAKGLTKFPKQVKTSGIAFVFTGQGAQVYRMGLELLQHQLFATHLQEADEYLHSLGSSWSVVEELARDQFSSNVDDARYSQPLCTILQTGLVDLLASWGVLPKSVVGHSSGEIAAAYASGALTREQAWKVAYFRGFWSGAISEKTSDYQGSMLAVGLGEQEVNAYLAEFDDTEVVLACINSPRSTTLSGSATSIANIRKKLAADDVFSSVLRVKVAYHSPAMIAISEDYFDSIRDLEPSTDAKATMYSSVTGVAIDPLALDARYWVNNMLNPVKFTAAVESLLSVNTTARGRRKTKLSVDAFLEIGPHGSLQDPLKQIASLDEKNQAQIAFLTVLQRGKDASRTAYDAIGKLWARGHTVDLLQMNIPRGTYKSQGPVAQLPPYPWNRGDKFRYWHEGPMVKMRRLPKGARTDLLGVLEDDNSHTPTYRNALRLDENPWLIDHNVQGMVVYPAAGFITMAVQAALLNAAENREVARVELRDLIVQRPLLFQDPTKALETRCSLRPHKMGTRLSSAPWTSVTIYSRSMIDNSWNEHSSCLFMVHYKTDPSDVEGISELSREAKHQQEMYNQYKAQCAVETTPASIYGQLSAAGFNYGPLFKTIRSAYSGDYMAVGKFAIPDTAKVMPKNFEYPHTVHPVTLDGFFHLVVAALRSTGYNSTMLPTATGSIIIDLDIPTTPGTELIGYTTVKKQGLREMMANIVVSTGEFEKPLVTFQDLYLQEVAGIMNIQKPHVSQAKHIASQIFWKEDAQLLPAAELSDLLGKAVSPMPTLPETNEVQTLDPIAGAIGRCIRSQKSSEDVTSSSPIDQIVSYVCQRVNATTGNVPPFPRFPLSLLDSSASARGLQSLWNDLQDSFEDHEKRFAPKDLPIAIAKILNELDSTKQLLPVLGALVDLQAFKTPAFKVLEIGSTDTEIAMLLLDRLSDQGKVLQLEKYFITNAQPKPTWAIELQKKEPKAIEYCQFDFTDSKQELPIEQGSLDSVICSNSLMDTHEFSTVAQRAFEMLKPGGKLTVILTTKTSGAADLLRATSSLYMGAEGATPTSWLFDDAMTQTQLRDVLLQAGFTGIDASVSSQPDSPNMATLLTTTKPFESVTSTNEILLLEPALHDSNVLSLIAGLVESFTSAGHQVTRATLQDLPDTKEKIVISCIEIGQPIFNDIGVSDFANWKRMLFNNQGVLWLTCGAQITTAQNPLASLTTGALRTARSEAPHVRLVHFDLSETLALAAPTTVKMIMDVFKNTIMVPEDAFYEPELTESGGRVMIPRLFTEHDMNAAIHYHTYEPVAVKRTLGASSETLMLTVGTPGMLDTLRFMINESAPKTLPAGHAKVKVTATPINFVDVMVAMGMVPSFGIGCECAGVVVEAHEGGKFKLGDQVAVLTRNAFSNFIVEDESMMQPVPESMTAAEAASCATIYVTAYVGLIDVARIQKGESVLIHAGAGGLGQAAIQLCQMIGAEIFVTVGSTAKKALLMDKYNIADDHVFNSRDLTFAKGIMRQTKQRGVDVILNSTSGEALRQTWHCIAPFGRFLEVGKRDIIMNTGLDMTPFLRNVTYAGVHIDQMTGPFAGRVSVAMAKVFDLLAAGKIGTVHPVTLMTYSALEDAFRTVQQGKHSGKVVLTASDDDTVSVVPACLDTFILKPDVTYAIGGGLGGVGRSIVDMMYNHGARHFAFFSRSGDARPDAKQYLEALRARGADARAFKADLGKIESLSAAIAEMSEQMPPVAGFLNSAMNLQDSLLEIMTHEQWMTCLAPKVNGSWNFHKLLPNNLDFFVLLSSIASIIGHPGQSNYAAANGYQDMLAHHRRSIGQNATSVNLGAIFGVGHIEDNHKADDIRMKLYEMVCVDEKEVQVLIGSAMKGTTTAGTPMPAQVVTGVNPTVLNVPSLKWAEDPKFDVIRRKAQVADSAAVDDSAKSKLLDDLASCTTLVAAAAVIEEAMVIKLARSMMVSPEDINTQKPLNSFGVDSLVAVEVRNWIFKELKSEVTVFDLMDPQPVTALIVKIAERSKLIPDEIKAKGKEE